MISPSLGVIKPGVLGGGAGSSPESLISFLQKKNGRMGCDKMGWERKGREGKKQVGMNLNFRGSDQMCLQTCSGLFIKNILRDSGGPVEGQFTTKAPLRLQFLGSIQKIFGPFYMQSTSGE